MLAQKKTTQNQFVEKAKSENGASTNLSEGSNEVDDEFKQKKGEKFEFINEKVNEWPQWSVEQKNQQPKEVQQQAVEEIQKIDFDDEFMYNRGFSFPIKRKKAPKPTTTESK